MGNNKRVHYVLGVLLAALLLGMALQGFRTSPGRSAVNAAKPNAMTNEANQSPQLVESTSSGTSTLRTTGKEIVVHVSGAVVKPGVYRLPSGSRVDDALLKAEATLEADTEALNRAAQLIDGQKLVVPSRQLDVVNNGANKVGEISPAKSAINKAEPYKVESHPVNISPAIGKSVNINTADVAELDRLPGIGPAIAQRIVQYRQQKGPFQRIEELQDVPGIGAKKFADLKERISVVD